MILEMNDTLSQEAYVSLCEWLFAMWFGPDKLHHPGARYIARRSLSVLHKAYSQHQACPVWWAKQYRERTLRLLDSYHKGIDAKRYAKYFARRAA